MILADTSVWVQHLRRRDEWFAERLAARGVAIHPFVIGELALGDLRPRAEVLDSLRRLPRTPVASHAEIELLIEQERLCATGIGHIDAHLLASARLGEAPLATYDRPLRAIAERLGVLAA